MCFKDVVVREYERLHNGSGGVPVKGAYPLGLAWDHAEDVQKPVAAYEVERTPKRKPFAMPLEERERKALLDEFDESMAEDDAESEALRVQSELRALKLSRMATPGCNCKRSMCVLGSCPCYTWGLPCLDGFCSCLHCHNPYISDDLVDGALDKNAKALQAKFLAKEKDAQTQ